MDGEWILELTAPVPRDVEVGIGERRVGVIADALLVASGVLSLTTKGEILCKYLTSLQMPLELGLILHC